MQIEHSVVMAKGTTNAVVKNTTLQSENVESCVLKVINRMAFPNKEFKATVELTFSDPNKTDQKKSAQKPDKKVDENLIVLQTVIKDSAVDMDFEGYNGCAALKNGEAHCWNYGDIGAFKIDKLPSKVKAVAVRKFSNCFLLDTGEVYCYGTVNKKIRYTWSDGMSIMWRKQPPVKVNLSAKATKISVGYPHSCAILENEKIECWVDPADPYTVSGVDKPVTISVNMDGCSLSANGDVFCWKDPEWKELTEKKGSEISVVAKKMFSDAKSLSSGQAFNGAILKSGKIKLWRTPAYGPTKFEYGESIEKTIEDAKILAMGDTSKICTVTSSNKAQFWSKEKEKVFQNFPSNVVDMHLGEMDNGCLLLANGAVQCWGTYQGAYPKDTSRFH